MKQHNIKMTDKAFSRLILTSVLGFLVCIVCLCSTTYAWFTGSVCGENNKIQSATCTLAVSVCKDGAEVAFVSTADELQKTKTIECNGEYTVTLTLPKESASGYLVMTVGGQEYYSNYLQRSTEEDQKLTFTLNVATATSVTFTARWGIYSGECHVVNDGKLDIRLENQKA